MAGASSEDGPGICPICRSQDDYRVPTFTLWGGMVGHRLINHVYCNQCGTGFNSATGKSNLGRIIAYQAFMFVIFVPIFFILFLLLLNL
ncbi:MAG: hypothetical protein H6737_29050 [Alphaproteobacteria bacterium]|nr:hypothetical protein [Alphaproteobacteria bacterium]